MSEEVIPTSQGSRKNNWTIKALLDWASQYLQQHNPEATRYDAELLLSEALGMKRVNLYINFDKPIDTAEREVFKQNLLRCAQGEPVSYILKSKDFMGRSFYVDPNVLIPRADTEVLVEQVFDDLSEKREAPLEILDIGAGSGCIGISLALEFKNSRVKAWEFEPGAREVAKKNADLLGAENYEVLLKDLRDPGPEMTGFDVIVSNPPYVAESEKHLMSKSTLDHEPNVALFAEDEGRAMYPLIVSYACGHLNAGGRLFLEIGFRQADWVQGLLLESGSFENVKVVKDYGGHDRVVFGVLKGER